MLKLSPALKCLRVVASIRGELYYRPFANPRRPWRLLTFPVVLNPATLQSLQGAAEHAPPTVELAVVLPTVHSLFEPSLDCVSNALVFIPDPLRRLHRAFEVQHDRSHAETFLLNPAGLLQFVIVHRLPGPTLRTLMDLLGLMLQAGITDHGLEAELSTVCTASSNATTAGVNRPTAEVSS